MGACGLPSEKNSRNKCRWSIYPLIFILHHKRIHAINVTEILSKNSEKQQLAELANSTFQTMNNDNEGIKEKIPLVILY